MQELGISDIELRSRILQAAAAAEQLGPEQPFSPLLEKRQQQLQQELRQPAAAPQQQQEEEEWPAVWMYSQDCGEEQWDCAEPDMLQEQLGSQQQQQSLWQTVHDTWQEDQVQDDQQRQQLWQPGIDHRQDDQLQDNEQQQPGIEDWQEQEWHGNWQQQDDGQWQGRASDLQSVRVQGQGAQHQDPGQARDTEQQQQVAWPLQAQQQQQQHEQHHHWQQQWWRQPEQQQQPGIGPLRQLDMNQQLQAPASAQSGYTDNSSGTDRTAPAGTAQSSIIGFVSRQQQQKRPRDAKEQWRALFKHPKRPLGAHNPAQQGPREVRQARIGPQGQVTRAPQQLTPAAAAALAPLPELPQAPGAGLPRWAVTQMPVVQMAQ
jgi:hypothetical protein